MSKKSPIVSTLLLGLRLTVLAVIFAFACKAIPSAAGLIVGVAVCMGLLGLTGHFVERLYNEQNGHVGTLGFVLAGAVFPLLLALPALLTAEYSQHLAINIPALAALSVWGTFPALARRRVRRFDANMIRQSVGVLNGEQVRSRLVLLLPFLLHPATFFILFKVVGTGGNLTVQATRPVRPKAKAKADDDDRLDSIRQSHIRTSLDFY